MIFHIQKMNFRWAAKISAKHFPIMGWNFQEEEGSLEEENFSEGEISDQESLEDEFSDEEHN